MLYKLWINLLILLKILTFIRGYPDGAPERACFIMVPRHTHPHTYRPIFKQHGPSPYNITLSRTTWRSDTAIRVTIGGAPFKGFMLTACEDGHTDWPTGIFYSESPDARPLWCVDRNDAITHNNSNWKSSVTVLWYGPQFSSADHVVFIATVVTNRTTYWTSIKSSMIVQDATQTAAAGGGEAPEGGAQTGMMPGLDAWGYPTTPSWNWGGGGGGRGGGGGGRGGGGSWRGGGDGGFGMFGGGGGRGGGRGGQGGGGENTAGETTTTGWNSNSGGGSNSAWNRWAMNNMGGGGWTTTQAPERSNTWAPSLFGGGRGGGNSNNNNWGSNGGGGTGGTGGWGNNRGNNGGGSNPNGSSKTGGWGNGGGNNQGGPGGSEGNNWGNSGNRPPSGSWGNNGSSGGNNWGNNGSGQGGGSGGGGNRGNNRGGGGGGTAMNNWQMRLMRQLLGFKR